jgi:nitroimidazol reductase NimA-like FMN-containing flavoprotein (pyridoxamine 5'-phosphate oxidase superfamily)
MGDEAARLEPLTHEECLELLRRGRVGRIAFDVDEFPVILPVNFRLVETSGRVWIALRTRPGNVIERAPLHVAFQIDEVDPARHEGWSVLARGTLHPVDPDAADFNERFDPHPWIEADRESWLIIDPFALTGRRLHGAQPEWAFTDGAFR